MLMIDESFREAIDKDYTPKLDDVKTVSIDEIEDFRARVKLFLNKE